MKSLWKDQEARKFKNNLLDLRVYTSQLLGQNPDLVLHGGGNTSVKIKERNIFGEVEEILYVKGSGWDLKTIQRAGFAPIKMSALLKMAKLKTMTDSQMVKEQRAAMIEPSAPNPSVEAILHAIIPFRFVDHTHADRVVTITNTPDGAKRIKEVYGNRVLYVPYVMPGFILARAIYELTRNLDWQKIEGIVLLNHGIFTFHDDAKKSYEKMIELVTKAEKYISRKSKVALKSVTPKEDLLNLARIRRETSILAGKPFIVQLDQSKENVSFSALGNVKTIATRGPLTPDHVIRTKIIPVVFKTDVRKDLQSYALEYKKYFNRHKNNTLTMLDPAPRWAIWPSFGTIGFGASFADAQIATDINQHTIRAILEAEGVGAWKALPEKDLFEMEYWELEQAKLKKSSNRPSLQGKIAIVTGAASGIGKASVEALYKEGACVAAIDIDPKIKGLFNKKEILEIQADLTNNKSVKNCIEKVVRAFGGLDIVVSNAGIFPVSENIKDLSDDKWQKSLDINLSSHAVLIKESIAYLELGFNPTVIIVGSKNVAAPGPGVAAYSVAKAGLTQLSRVAALELAASKIRVNVIHPNQVFDTALWTKEVLEKRAKHYGVSVEEYKTNNLLKVEIASKDVAALVVSLAGERFYKTTGAQIPIDGGNDRVI